MTNSSLLDYTADFQPFFEQNWGRIAKLKAELGFARKEATKARQSWQAESHWSNRRIASLEAENRRLKEQIRALAKINQLSLEVRK